MPQAIYKTSMSFELIKKHLEFCFAVLNYAQNFSSQKTFDGMRLNKSRYASGTRKLTYTFSYFIQNFNNLEISSC